MKAFLEGSLNVLNPLEVEMYEGNMFRTRILVKGSSLRDQKTQNSQTLGHQIPSKKLETGMFLEA